MNYPSKTEQFKALCSPFPVEAIKQRQQGGATLSYYPVEVIRTRLNEVFAGDYEFRTNNTITTESTMDMSCTLTLRWVDGTTTIVEEWGSSDILHSRDGKRRANDPAKNCCSDALKRCLAFVGCGAELYNEAYRESIADRKQQQEEESEKEGFTCADCQCTITDTRTRFRVIPARESAKTSMDRHKRCLCIPCAAKATAAERLSA